VSEDNEAFYDDEIAPVLADLCRKCEERGIPFVATVEYASEAYGTTAAFPKERGLAIEWAYIAARSNGNADVLIGHLVRQAEERGHGSVYLNMLKVPLTPGESR